MVAMSLLHCVVSIFLLDVVLWRVEAAEWASSTLATIPLAIRTPYLNLWIDTYTAEGKALPSTGRAWPNMWNKRTFGWSAIARVDGVPYEWQGIVTNSTTTASGSIKMSPTRTTLNAIAGPVQLTLIYLSPIEPSDWVKQSFPFSYMAVDVSSTDGQKHDVQLYSDITGELLSENVADVMDFKATQTSKSYYHTLAMSSPSHFLESKDQAEDGALYLATSKTSATTYQTGDCAALRLAFIRNGTLANTQDSKTTRPILDPDGHIWSCGGLAIDLGSISQSSSPTVWAIGYVREPAIRATTASGSESRTLYFNTKYSSIDQAIDDFLTDFSDASKRAQDLDNKIMNDGASISSSYANLLAFSSRLAFGAMDITVPKSSSNKLDASDVKVYMKDVGHSSRTNPVDILFSAFPAFLYLNSTLAGLLLEPMLSFVATSTYHNNYSASDLGSTYPDARGNTSESNLGLETSGSMLIMALAHARKSGDGTLCQRNYGVLKKWADYLNDNALNNTSAVTSDGIVPPGDVNLALKAIVGVKAMSEINAFLEPRGASKTDTQSYATKAQSLAQSWKTQAWSKDRLTATFGDAGSWSLLYNAYADKLLKTSVIGDDVYQAQASLYASQSSSAPSYGFPYDSRSLLARSDFTMLTAAAVTDNVVRDLMIQQVHKRATWLNSTNAWPTNYWAHDAATFSSQSNPGHGAVFAVLALNLPDQSIRLDSSLKITSQGTTASESKRTNAGAIAGGVIGGIALLALIALGIFLCRRRQQTRKDRDIAEGKEDPIITPYNPYLGIENVSTPTHSTGLASEGPAMNPKSMPRPLRPSGSDDRHFGGPLSTTLHSGSAGSQSAAAANDHPSSEATSTLRQEMEELRREMALMRHRNQTPVVDAPPQYYNAGHL